MPSQAVMRFIKYNQRHVGHSKQISFINQEIEENIWRHYQHVYRTVHQGLQDSHPSWIFSRLKFPFSCEDFYTQTW
jgi:hypothetical protein